MKAAIIFFALILIHPGYAKEIECYLTVVKNDCWKTYNVDVTLTDLASKEKIVSLRAPSGKLWSRDKFTCTLGKVLEYSATYSPVFWQTDQGKVFYSNKYWTLPESLAENQAALNITICFPEQFVGTPIPPDATAKCKCDTSVAPEIKLKPRVSPANP